MTIPEIIQQYRAQQALSLREFAWQISQVVPVSYQTILNWETGATKPEYATMLALALGSNGWIASMGLEVLQAIKSNQIKEQKHEYAD